MPKLLCLLCLPFLVSIGCSSQGFKATEQNDSEGQLCHPAFLEGIGDIIELRQQAIESKSRVALDRSCRAFLKKFDGQVCILHNEGQPSLIDMDSIRQLCQDLQ